MWMILFPESTAIECLENWTYRRIHSKETHPPMGAQSHSGHQIHICTEIHQMGWSSKCTVLKGEGISQRGCTCHPEGQSSQGLDPETSHLALSTGTRVGGGSLVPVKGSSVLRDLGRLLQHVFLRSSGDCWGVEQRQDHAWLGLKSLR